MKNSETVFDKKIINCSQCPRLRAFCTQIADTKKKAFANWNYWGKPVPNFGSSSAELLIVGLAPAAHGANRTGRMFTGDQSGLWLYRALYRAGFANQELAQHRNDGLKLQNCLITAVCHCAPPENKPTLQEVAHCSIFLEETFQSAQRKKIILALGHIAWINTWKIIKKKGTDFETHYQKFTHGAEVLLPNGITVMASYHPSQQNTFTGKLTERAFDSLFFRCKEILTGH